MDSSRRPPPIEEKAPSLFGWIRGGLNRTKDDAAINPQMGRVNPTTGQVNVGVSTPRRRRFRLPGGGIAWIVVIAVIALALAILIPVAGQVIDAFDEGFQEAIQDNNGHDKGSKRDSTGPGTISIEQGDLTQDRIDKEPEPGAPPVQAPTDIDDLTRMSDCVAEAAGDVDRILACMKR